MFVFNSTHVSYRLYRQLAEVQQQKEEKAEQEAHAQDRRRAGGFPQVSSPARAHGCVCEDVPAVPGVTVPSTENAGETSRQKYMLAFPTKSVRGLLFF